jgi:hypothetical protein
MPPILFLVTTWGTEREQSSFPWKLVQEIPFLAIMYICALNEPMECETFECTAGDMTADISTVLLVLELSM